MAANGAGTRCSQGGSRACVDEWIVESPTGSMAVLFGVGLAAGLLLGHTLAEAAGRKMFHEDSLTEKLTGQIRDLVKSHLPTSMSRHLS